MTGELWLVATPIGHLGDVSDRMRESLREADAILAEDTRRTRALLNHLGITGKAVERFDAHVEGRATDAVLDRLADGARLALVSDAGTPVVSDPGARLVEGAVARGVTVTPVPGPCAVITALAASGFPGDRFRFLGFWPRAKKDRRDALATVAETEEAVVFYESPTRTASTLGELAERQPGRRGVVARELTKKHEELRRGTLEELAAVETWRGEITIVLGPMSREETPEVDVAARIEALRAEGLRDKDVAKALALETGMTSSEAYRRVIAAKDDTDE